MPSRKHTLVLRAYMTLHISCSEVVLRVCDSEGSTSIFSIMILVPLTGRAVAAVLVA
jgi:hypothetical protein